MNSGYNGYGYHGFVWWIKGLLCCMAVSFLLVTLIPLAVGDSEVKKSALTEAKTAADYYQLGMELAKLKPNLQKKEDTLASLEQAVKLDPANLKYGNDYRMSTIAFGEFDRAINFFEGQVAQNKNQFELYINLAFAYIDKMPTVGTVRQGLLSNKSIARLNKGLELNQNSWIALYGRGMNHLHWPKMLGKAKYAIDDFKRCLDIQNAQKDKKPYFVLTYIALGDSYVKNDQVDEAIKIWQQGRALYPDDPGLASRVNQKKSDLKDFVDKERDIAKRIDTNLEALWKP